MTTETWHLPAALLDRYAAFDLAPSGRASVEAHLQACATCRAVVADSAAAADLAPRLDEAWAGTIDRIDAPRRGLLHRIATAVGVPDHLARLIGASAAFRAAWLVSVVLVVAAATAIARGDLGAAPFLLLSPLVPVIGVAAAFGGSTRSSDTRPFEVATPFGELRLVLLRSAAVTATSIALLGATTLVLPATGPEALAWLLPALALTTTTLAASTRFAPERAASGVVAGWVLLVAFLAIELPRADRPTADDLGALAAPLQLTAVVLLLVSAVVFLARRDRLDLPTR